MQQAGKQDLKELLPFPNPPEKHRTFSNSMSAKWNTQLEN